jgi:hypothetical protein
MEEEDSKGKTSQMLRSVKRKIQRSRPRQMGREKRERE